MSARSENEGFLGQQGGRRSLNTPALVIDRSALQRNIDLDSDGRYATLPGEIDVLIQSAIPGREGMHVDIETDDVNAEVARLEKLGASKREQVRDWWVMTAPDGQPFCVVPVQSENWPRGAVTWE